MTRVLSNLLRWSVHYRVYCISVWNWVKSSLSLFDTVDLFQWLCIFLKLWLLSSHRCNSLVMKLKTNLGLIDLMLLLRRLNAFIWYVVLILLYIFVGSWVPGSKFQQQHIVVALHNAQHMYFREKIVVKTRIWMTILMMINMIPRTLLLMMLSWLVYIFIFISHANFIFC